MSADAAAIDPFHPLLRIVDRYRQDVHDLQPPSAPEQLADADRRLQTPVPPSLQAFLLRWNGATLFRGALNLRAAAELAPASERAAAVVVFADGPRPEDHWAYAPADPEGAVFGRWADGAFSPLHERFDRWLFATLRILDEDLHEPERTLQARLDADPDCAFLLLAQAEVHLAEGDPEAARNLLRRATAADPGLVPAWERLGETLLGEDRQGARWAFLKALRAVRLPRPFPTTHSVAPALMRTLTRLFPVGDEAWETELARFIDESVTDCADWRELALVEAAATELARVRLTRADRTAARDGLVLLLERARAFAWRGVMTEVVLLLAKIEADLGLHDDAERHLRVLRHAPPEVRAQGDLVLGRIAVIRQEPWAEEILAPLDRLLVDPVDRCTVDLLRGERALRVEDLDAAEAALDRSLAEAERLQSASLFGQTWLLRGDLALRRNDPPAAEEAFRKARAGGDNDPELLERVLLRRGDLYAMTGDPERAIDDYMRAVEGFRNLELPLREAWAQVRLARLKVEGAADRARTLFQAADHAAGVAAADAAMGNVGASLEWHLGRATEHARDRANAQRPRAPLVRADADRPERRLGAHRLAIASSSGAIVRALATELVQRAKELERGEGRPTDPCLVHYVAAADLLAGHRSYEAAEVLLRQLLEVKPAGSARQALVGAMSRSPNTALVLGLVEALDEAGDPAAVAAAAEVLGWRREPEAVSRLRELTAEGVHPTVRKAAVVALGRIGDEQAVPDLLHALDNSELASAAAVALLLLGEWAGVDHVGQALALVSTEGGTVDVKGGPGLRRSMGELVGRYGGPAYLLLLLRVAESEGSAALGALQGLGYLGDPRAVTRLVDACAGRDPQRARVAGAALEMITGHHEDSEESLLRNRWQSWWEANCGAFEDGQRYRHGRLMDPGLLIERMSHDDLLVRRSTYDELVIGTGICMPFDADGPYRIQVLHQSRWREWWAGELDQWRSGRWTFHGDDVS